MIKLLSHQRSYLQGSKIHNSDLLTRLMMMKVNQLLLSLFRYFPNLIVKSLEFLAQVMHIIMKCIHLYNSLDLFAERLDSSIKLMLSRVGMHFLQSLYYFQDLMIDILSY